MDKMIMASSSMRPESRKGSTASSGSVKHSSTPNSQRILPNVNIIPTTVHSVKEELITDLTRAIQLIQKTYLEKDEEDKRLTNSDYQVHELCQQLDKIFLFGLKKPEEGGYWVVVLEFTHRNVTDDIRRLLNVTTSYGRGRAWIYHALNDNLMESYLRCFLENKKRANKYYKKEGAMLNDDQIVTVLVTLMAGLENVEFKLQNDVPYLDHSCWPPHFSLKRQVVDTILKSSPQTLSQLIDINGSLNDSTLGLSTSFQSHSFPNNKHLETTLQRVKTVGKRVNDRRTANNISFDDYSTHSSTNNLSDFNHNDSNVMESGSSALASSSRNDDYLQAHYKRKPRKLAKSSVLRANSKKSDYDEPDQYSENGEESSDQHYTKSDSVNSVCSELEMEKLANMSIINNNEEQHKQLTGSVYSDQIENEIDKMKLENNLIDKRSASTSSSNTQQISSTTTLIKTLRNDDLANTSLQASHHFDQKIEHIENYSNIIENATLKMDACVKDMNIVYENYEKIYDESSTNEDEVASSKRHSADYSEVYDFKSDENETEKLSSREKAFSHSSLTSFQTTDETYSVKMMDKDQYSISSTNTNNAAKEQCDNNYLDDTMANFDQIDQVRQEVKVDNNTKLVISIEIFQNGQNEEFIKLYKATRGHSQGELEAINLMITTHGVYILTKREKTEVAKSSGVASAGSSGGRTVLKLKKESFINHAQIDYIEIALCQQAIHFVCINKRQNCWITTSSRNLTLNILEHLQSSRLQNNLLKLSKLSVFDDATSQSLAMKKFISSEESKDPPDVELKGYSLIFWEDQASIQNHLIYKEGSLIFYSKSNHGAISEWKKAFFILKNNVLTQFKSSKDKRPTNVIRLNGEDFSGCRKCNSSSRPYTIELILSNSVLYLSAKNEAEASEWLQSFCKVISLGNYDTDVPSQSCLPCASIITSHKIYFCHENLNTGFYRLLESIKLQEINRISFDNDNPYYCILHDDIDSDVKKHRVWFIYFIDRNERNHFITNFKEAWEAMFQVQFTVEKCRDSETMKKCIKQTRQIHQVWENGGDFN